MRLVSGVPHIAIVGEATWSGFGIFDSGFIQNSQAVRSVRFQVSIEVFRIGAKRRKTAEVSPKGEIYVINSGFRGETGFPNFNQR